MKHRAYSYVITFNSCISFPTNNCQPTLAPPCSSMMNTVIIMLLFLTMRDKLRRSGRSQPILNLGNTLHRIRNIYIVWLNQTFCPFSMCTFVSLSECIKSVINLAFSVWKTVSLRGVGNAWCAMMKFRLLAWKVFSLKLTACWTITLKYSSLGKQVVFKKTVTWKVNRVLRAYTLVLLSVIESVCSESVLHLLFTLATINAIP